MKATSRSTPPAQNYGPLTAPVPANLRIATSPTRSTFQSTHSTSPIHVFIHLDTCFAPLHGGYLLYYPGAFDGASNAAIEAAFPAEKRLPVSERDAIRLACSALNVGNHIYVGEISDALTDILQARGFFVERLPLGEFLKGGGGAKSLALRLSDLSVTHG